MHRTVQSQIKNNNNIIRTHYIAPSYKTVHFCDVVHQKKITQPNRNIFNNMTTQTMNVLAQSIMPFYCVDTDNTQHQRFQTHQIQSNTNMNQINHAYYSFRINTFDIKK